MRKQYHFRPSKRGLQAWDVHRLLELSSGLPVYAHPLDAIGEIDEAYWFGDDEEQPTCRSLLEHMKLIRDASLEHPIILSSDGRLMDGMHRVIKALLEGRSEIDAVRFTEDPQPDHVGVRPSELPY